MVVKERDNSMIETFGLQYGPSGEKKRGVVLLSGGLDSAVTAWTAKQDCDELFAITFEYGQAHWREVKCAIQLALELDVQKHLIIELPLNQVGGSSLFNRDDIPIIKTKGIPTTWVPQRNAIFLAVAFGWAEVVGTDRVYIGVNEVDYGGYPDCRPRFISAMNVALNLASKQFAETGSGVQIMTPIIDQSKKRIVELGLKLGVPFEKTFSCYKGGEKACGKCSSCKIRLRGFAEAGIKDPIEYEELKDERNDS